MMQQHTIPASHLVGLLIQREARSLLLPDVDDPVEWEARLTKAERDALAEYKERVNECIIYLMERV